MVFDVFVGFILLVLTKDLLAGHSGDDGKVCWWSLGYGRVTPVQEKLSVVDDPSSCNRTREFSIIHGPFLGNMTVSRTVCVASQKNDNHIASSVRTGSECLNNCNNRQDLHQT